MIRIDPKTTACVTIDMHRGHLDPAVATLPLLAERCGPVIERAAKLLDALRRRGVPIVHVVTEYRDPEEIKSNPFWRGEPGDNRPKPRQGVFTHNLVGGRGTEVIPALLRDGDHVLRGKKRYSPYLGTGLLFLLRNRLGVGTLILAGINTTSCVLCSAFESTNLDFRVVIASDAVDTVDGPEMHRFALELMSRTVGWPMTNAEIAQALTA
ncbi:MAG: cysteine hydrolase [Stellaceae bacterium]